MRRVLRHLLLVVSLFVTALVGAGNAGAAPKPGGAVATLAFAGRTWTVKTSTGLVGPGPNVFSASNVTVDGNGRLNLSIVKRSGRWTCAEVVLNQSLGYGTYEWTLGSNVANLDAQAVLGLFTWNDDPAYHHREIDFEASRWGVPSSATNAQWVVQPWDTAGNLRRFTIGSSVPTVVRIVWSPTSVAFSTLVGGTPVEQWTYTGPDIPVPGGENARINLWLYQGKAPAAKKVTVTVADFAYRAPA